MGDFEEIRVESWEGAQRRLYADSWDAELGRYRHQYAFRGLPDAGYGMETTLQRLGMGDPEHGAEVEGHLLRNFRKYARPGRLEGKSFWHVLSVAQHHGLPTRLLDWTFSPLVALHFATADVTSTDTDGLVWLVDYRGVHDHLPESLDERMGDADVFTAEMLSSASNSLAEFDDLFDDPSPVFFEPPALDDRIVNQYALFSVLPDPTLLFDAWLEEHPSVCRRVVVPGEVKVEIRDKLDQANVTERVLFPGLDGLTDWLARHYAPVDATPPDESVEDG